MEIILEIVSRGGRTLERQRVNRSRITIGRAFDNDVILSDDTVDPHHAVVSENGTGELQINDLGSVNGTRIDGHGITETTRFDSGDEFGFGRARVRIYHVHHAVGDTVRIGGFDGLINHLGKTSTTLALLAIVLSATVFEIWLNSYSGMRWQQVGLGVFSVVTASAVVALFFAILGRIVKHEGRFQTQFSVVLIYLIAQSIVVYAYELILFNTLNFVVSVALGLAASYLLLCQALTLNLHIATYLTNRQVWKFSLAFTSVLLCVSVYPQIVERTEFSNSPRYVKEIKPPLLRVSGSMDADEFLKMTAKLYAATDGIDD